MKVLFVYQFLTLGGVESVVRARLAGMGAFGDDVDAWFMSDEGGLGTFAGLHDRVHIGGIEALKRFMVANPPDAIVSIDTEEALHFGNRNGVGPLLVLECHTTYPENLDYLSRLDRKRVQAVFVPSEHQRRIVAARLPKGIPIEIVRNPVGRAFIRGMLPSRKVPSDRVVAWVGRLDALKNWEAFLDFAAQLVKSSQGIQYWMIGDTSERTVAQRLYQLAKERQLLPQLRWFRQVPYARMPGLHSVIRMSGGLLVSTSRNESFGLAVAEAMASGIAVLAPRQGPFPDLIRDNVTGCLYDPGEIPAAVEKAAAVLRNDALRIQLGEAARRDVATRLAPEVALESLANALEAVAAHAHSLAP